MEMGRVEMGRVSGFQARRGHSEIPSKHENPLSSAHTMFWWLLFGASQSHAVPHFGAEYCRTWAKRGRHSSRDAQAFSQGHHRA